MRENGAVCVCFGIDEGCERRKSGVVKTKFNASHDGINYSKMGIQTIQASKVRSYLMLKMTLKRPVTMVVGGGGHKL